MPAAAASLHPSLGADHSKVVDDRGLALGLSISAHVLAAIGAGLGAFADFARRITRP
ncbi:hypothetical protein [Cryobacterium sp. PH31-O1]|uniref:hypothetical protein n=1 Tax=Cryobacterium sp. PH31-O1 TaxID=3046306 RepID=UPI0024BB9FBE|nr:hypothetical protein [Cryobacterium sp. PH31-O1]MDJ0336872.1 hypothetical protein [Cryobacterium sp. PH31-O1]